MKNFRLIFVLICISLSIHAIASSKGKVLLVKGKKAAPEQGFDRDQDVQLDSLEQQILEYTKSHVEQQQLDRWSFDAGLSRIRLQAEAGINETLEYHVKTRIFKLVEESRNPHPDVSFDATLQAATQYHTDIWVKRFVDLTADVDKIKEQGKALETMLQRIALFKNRFDRQYFNYNKASILTRAAKYSGMGRFTAFYLMANYPMEKSDQYDLFNGRGRAFLRKLEVQLWAIKGIQPSEEEVPLALPLLQIKPQFKDDQTPLAIAVASMVHMGTVVNVQQDQVLQQQRAKQEFDLKTKHLEKYFLWDAIDNTLLAYLKLTTADLTDDIRTKLTAKFNAESFAWSNLCVEVAEEINADLGRKQIGARIRNFPFALRDRNQDYWQRVAEYESSHQPLDKFYTDVAKKLRKKWFLFGEGPMPEKDWDDHVKKVEQKVRTAHANDSNKLKSDELDATKASFYKAKKEFIASGRGGTLTEDMVDKMETIQLLDRSTVWESAYSFGVRQALKKRIEKREEAERAAVLDYDVEKISIFKEKIWASYAKVLKEVMKAAQGFVTENRLDFILMQCRLNASKAQKQLLETITMVERNQAMSSLLLERLTEELLLARSKKEFRVRAKFMAQVLLRGKTSAFASFNKQVEEAIRRAGEKLFKGLSDRERQEYKNSFLQYLQALDNKKGEEELQESENDSYDDAMNAESRFSRTHASLPLCMPIPQGYVTRCMICNEHVPTFFGSYGDIQADAEEELADLAIILPTNSIMNSSGHGKLSDISVSCGHPLCWECIKDRDLVMEPVQCHCGQQVPTSQLDLDARRMHFGEWRSKFSSGHDEACPNPDD